MFKKKKILEQIEQQIQELQFIKQCLEDSSPKVDIRNVFVYENKNLYRIVRLEEKRITGVNIFGKISNGYESTLIDIFSNEIVYENCSVYSLIEKEIVEPKFISIGQYLHSIHRVDHNLLAYADKQVPLYVLQQLYYNINNINFDSPVLKKKR